MYKPLPNQGDEGVSQASFLAFCPHRLIKYDEIKPFCIVLYCIIDGPELLVCDIISNPKI